MSSVTLRKRLVCETGANDALQDQMNDVQRLSFQTYFSASEITCRLSREINTLPINAYVLQSVWVSPHVVVIAEYHSPREFGALSIKAT